MLVKHFYSQSLLEDSEECGSKEYSRKQDKEELWRQNLYFNFIFLCSRIFIEPQVPNFFIYKYLYAIF